jgi:hypothetical protein
VEADTEELTKFGGMNIFYDRDRGILKIDQVHLIEVGAKRFGIDSNTASVPSPMDERRIISRDECPKEQASPEDVSRMQSINGTVGYISSCTRPGLKYHQSSCSRVADNPSKQHLKDGLRGMIYLYQTRFIPLVYSRSTWIGPDGTVYYPQIAWGVRHYD